MIRLAPTPWEPAPTRYPQPEAPPALRVTHPTRHAPRACRASSFTASSRHTCVVWTRPVYIPKHAHTFVIHSLLPFRFAIPHDTSEPRASLVSVPLHAQHQVRFSWPACSGFALTGIRARSPPRLELALGADCVGEFDQDLQPMIRPTHFCRHPPRATDRLRLAHLPCSFSALSTHPEHTRAAVCQTDAPISVRVHAVRCLYTRRFFLMRLYAALDEV